MSTYSFESHKKTAQIKLLDIANGHSTVLVEDLSASEPTWLEDDVFLYLKGGDKGTTKIIVDSASHPGSE